MRRAFCIVLSGITAYAITAAYWSWERKYSCTITACGPDESGTLVFGLLWPVLDWVAAKGTRLK